jgi:8-oxo-dGTP diphosphatase
MSNKEDRAKIKACVGVMIFKDGKFLMGKRKGSHGAGEYSCAGGHLEFGESFEECAKREVLEETGVNIKNIKFLSVANIFKDENRQDVVINLVADWKSGEPKTDPNEKIGEWQWCSPNELPEPVFYPSFSTIDSYKTGRNFYDKE